MRRYRITIRGGSLVDKAEITLISPGGAALDATAERICTQLDATAYVDAVEELA